MTVSSFELERAEVDELGLRILAAGDVSAHGGRDFRTGSSGDGDHDENPGGGAAPLAQFVECGDHGFRFRSPVFAEVNEDDVRARLEFSVGEAGAGAGELIDKCGDLGIVAAAARPGISAEGEAGFRVS